MSDVISTDKTKALLDRLQGLPTKDRQWVESRLPQMARVKLAELRRAELEAANAVGADADEAPVAEAEDTPDAANDDQVPDRPAFDLSGFSPDVRTLLEDISAMRKLPVALSEALVGLAEAAASVPTPVEAQHITPQTSRRSRRRRLFRS